jgi:hypothetical protein
MMMRNLHHHLLSFSSRQLSSRRTNVIIYDDDLVWEYEDAFFSDPTTEAIVFSIWMICGGISVVGCYVVIREAVTDLKQQQQQRGRTSKRNRAIPFQYASMCLAYGFYGLSILLGPLPAPSSTKAWGTFGSVGTCTAQGFFVLFGAVAAAILNASIIWMFRRMIRSFNSYSDDTLWAAVPWINGFAWTTAFGMAVVQIFF